jgi:hypothetical protein
VSFDDCYRITRVVFLVHASVHTQQYLVIFFFSRLTAMDPALQFPPTVDQRRLAFDSAVAHCPRFFNVPAASPSPYAETEQKIRAMRMLVKHGQKESDFYPRAKV